MHYSGIKWTDTANGLGIRISLFVSGCSHGCPGCFNQEAWDFQAGSPFTPEIAEEIIDKLGASYIKGFSLLGGEPLAPKNQAACLALLKQIRKAYPQKDIWCYSGYVFDDLVSGKVGESAKEILSVIDILVDGLFDETKKNLSLRFRGSENQRIISCQSSLEKNEIILWNPPE